MRTKLLYLWDNYIAANKTKTFCVLLAGIGVTLQRSLLAAVLQNKTKHSTAFKTLVKLNIHVSKLPDTPC